MPSSRGLWSGSLSFGLVNIPVRLLSASKERPLSFRLLAKDDLCPISYKKVCREDDKVVHQDEIVKGYEYRKGEYVVLDPDDFKKARAVKTDLIDIVQFADPDEIDAKLYDKPYYIEPQKKSAKAYVLLRDALEKSGKVAIAKFVMRDREHIAAIRPEEGVLILDQLRFADELRDPKDLDVPARGDYSKKEMGLALSLVDNLTEPFRIGDFKDTYAKELKRVIEAKAKGKLAHIKEPAEETSPTNTADILAMLKESLKKDKKPAHSRR
jgi:DNA end-binding protein Ku